MHASVPDKSGLHKNKTDSSVTRARLRPNHNSRKPHQYRVFLDTRCITLLRRDTVTSCKKAQVEACTFAEHFFPAYSDGEQ